MTGLQDRIVSREEWLAARKALLDDEKAFTRARDALAERRRRLPVVRVEPEYRFETTEGVKSLAELFNGRRQLIIQHFMFGEGWEAGCPSCSFWADGFDRVTDHLAARDTAFVVVSNAALDKLLAYRDRMGWTFDWVSTANDSFSRDFDVTFRPEDAATARYNYAPKANPMTELPGISVFVALDDGGVAHSYSTYARGLDPMNPAYQLLDLTPLGRGEDETTPPMSWLKRRDEY